MKYADLAARPMHHDRWMLAQKRKPGGFLQSFKVSLFVRIETDAVQRSSALLLPQQSAQSCLKLNQRHISTIISRGSMRIPDLPGVLQLIRNRLRTEADSVFFE